jgi:hypothetical protein
VTIAIINKSTLCSNADVALWARACAKQLRYHVAPAYQQHAIPVIYYPDVTHMPPGAWPIYVLDDPDVAGALGYHDLDPHGNPYGRVFARPSLDHNITVSSVLSHEVVEAFADPDINLWAVNLHTGQFFAYEAADPVENDGYTITVSGHPITVSNFVLPAWYNALDTDGPYDYLGTVHAPYTMSKGGYCIVAAPGKESQIFGERLPWRISTKVAPGSRTARRVGPSEERATAVPVELEQLPIWDTEGAVPAE